MDRSNPNGEDRSGIDHVAGLTFPCVIAIKVFLLAGDSNHILVQELIMQHIEEIDLLDISVTESRTAKYQSLSCRVNAQSKVLMDRVYKTLSTHPDILMVL